MKKRDYKITGYPAFFLCFVPMLIGWIVIVKATVGALL